MDRGIVFKKAVKGGGVVGVFVGGQYLTAIITQVILARILEPSHFWGIGLCFYFNNLVLILNFLWLLFIEHRFEPDCGCFINTAK